MGEEAIFRIEGREGSGYLALPSSGKGDPVIVIQEWWGLVDHIKDLVDRFAEAGFVAFAPDLYHGQKASEPDTARKLMMELELENAGQEIQAAARYLTSLPQAKLDRVATVGFCMGGSLSIWSGTLSELIDRTIAFYPGASWERHNPAWKNFKNKRALIHCAEGDGTSKAPGIQQAKNEILGAGGEILLFDYPGTLHAFFNDDRPEVFNKSAATLAWQRTLDFLKR